MISCFKGILTSVNFIQTQSKGRIRKSSTVLSQIHHLHFIHAGSGGKSTQSDRLLLSNDAGADRDFLILLLGCWNALIGQFSVVQMGSNLSKCFTRILSVKNFQVIPKNTRFFKLSNVLYKLSEASKVLNSNNMIRVTCISSHTPSSFISTYSI